MVIRTVVTVVYFEVSAVAMHTMCRMLAHSVPVTQEAASKARARRWKHTVAAVVVSAWIGAACIAFGLNMPKAMCGVVFAGPVVITVPVLAWVFLVY